jgi:ribosomal protein S27AE
MKDTTLKVEDWSYVAEQLSKRFGFTKDHAEDAILRLSRDPQVFNEFVAYLRTGAAPERSVAGHTAAELMRNYGLSPVGAYLMLSELSANLQKGEGYLRDIQEHGHETPTYDDNGRVTRIRFTTVNADSSQGTPLCPRCGNRATWIKQYDRWYCYTCKEYV